MRESSLWRGLPARMRARMGMWLGISGCLIAAISFSSCTKSEEDPKLAIFHGSLGDDAKTLDPANAYDSVSLEIVPQIYETLYQYAYLADTYKVVPLLAADMPKYSADRLTVTIPIRKGIKFQNDAAFKSTQGKGRELTAEDFVYAWKRLADPRIESQGWWIFDGKIAGINAFHDKMTAAKSKEEAAKSFGDKIAGIQALDSQTLQIKLMQPYPQLLYILSMSFTAPVAREAVEAYGDEKGNLTEHPVGTGPFILSKWERDRRFVLDRNPDYHTEFFPTEMAQTYRQQGMAGEIGKQLPFLDRISIRVIKENQPRWLSFMKSELDLMGIPKDNFNSAITNQVNLSPELAARGIRLSIETGATFYYISFNMKDKLLGQNKFLRQALSSAIDRDKWIEVFTNNRGKKASTALPPGIPDRPASAKLKYDFNPERAKELLAKAGFPNGQGLPALNFDLRGSDSVSRQMGELFTAQFAAIGVKLNVIPNTFPAYLEKAKKGNLQIALGGWQMDYPDAENVYQLLYGPNQSPGPNETNYDSPEMNKLYKQMAVLESGPKRAALIQKMDELLQEDSPWALGYYVASYELSQPWLANYRSSDLIQNRYKYYRIDKATKARYLEKK